MESYGLNYFTNFHQKNVAGEISGENWIKKIQTGNDPSNRKILNARYFGKHTSEYDKIKSELPCVTWNFVFNNKLEGVNVIGGTGFLYIDLDDGYRPDIRTLPAEKIYAYYDSLSKTGKGLIVKVSELPREKEAFNVVYNHIVNDLGLTDYCKGSQKRTQCNVLSYDPNLHFNPNSKPYNAKEIIDISESNLQSEFFSSNRNQQQELLKQIELNIFRDKRLFRNNNIDEFCPDGEVFEYEEGIDIMQLFLPKTIKIGKRKHTLLGYCNNLVLLNPEMPKETIIKALDNCNVVHCKRPLELKEIRDIVNSIFKYKEAGTLRPQHLKKRKILFGKNTGLTSKEKLSYSAKRVAEWKRNETKHKIYVFLEEYNGEAKITAKSVAKNVNISIRTVERYWSEFKEYVKTINGKTRH